MIKKIYLILLVIMLLGIFWRFLKLADFPVQLNHDEVTQLYDAISVAQTSKDVYGNFLPFIFHSVGDFKPPFYTYITGVFYMVFGGGELTIRLPGVLFGILLIPAVFLFTLRLFKNNKIALMAAFFTAVAPFEIFFSRKSFENGAGIFLMILGFSSLLYYFEKKVKVRYLYIASLFFGLAIYTYFSHAIIIPILLSVFIFIFRQDFHSRKNIILPVLIFLLFFIPLLILTFTNEDSRNRTQAVFVTQDLNLVKEINLGNRIKATLDFSWNRYLDQFNPMYIFGNGLDFTNQGPLGVGPLLLIQLPLVILGIIYLVRLGDFNREKKFILAWILIGMLPSGLTFEPHSPHRSIMVFTMLNVISALGLYLLFKHRKLIVVLFILFIINYLYFLHMYFVNFPFEKSENIHYPFKQVALFAWSQHGSVDQIIFDPLFGETAPVIGTAAHYYMAYYGNFPPSKFQKEYRTGEKEREVLFDKFSIRKVEWRDDQYLKNVLIIGSRWSLPIESINKSKVVKTFNYYNGQPAFYAVKL